MAEDLLQQAYECQQQLKTAQDELDVVQASCDAAVQHVNALTSRSEELLMTMQAEYSDLLEHLQALQHNKTRLARQDNLQEAARYKMLAAGVRESLHDIEAIVGFLADQSTPHQDEVLQFHQRVYAQQLA